MEFIIVSYDISLSFSFALVVEGSWIFGGESCGENLFCKRCGSFLDLFAEARIFLGSFCRGADLYFVTSISRFNRTAKFFKIGRSTSHIRAASSVTLCSQAQSHSVYIAMEHTSSWYYSGVFILCTEYLTVSPGIKHFSHRVFLLF